MWKWLAIGLLLLVSGCVESSTTPAEGMDVVKSYPAHNRPIRLVLGDLPPGTPYEVLGKVKAIEEYYDGSAAVETKIANDARQIGADAIIKTKIWFSPRPLAWVAPHAEGLAVKLQQPDSLDFEKLPGSTR